MAALIELGLIVLIFGLVIWAIRRKDPKRTEGDKRRPD